MPQFEKVARVDELQPGQQKSVIVDDTPVLLVRVDDDYLAVEDVCSHDGQPLTDGPVLGAVITCPRHGARFDLRTGTALCMPATERVPTFLVEIREDSVFVASRDTEEESAPTPAPAAAGPRTRVTEDQTPVAAACASQADAGSVQDEAGRMPDDLALIDALRQVIDPELMVNVVDLGLVYNIETTDDSRINVDMTLTSPACPAGPQIMQQAKIALERLDGVREAEITLTMSPPWSPDRMTDEARDQLGIF